MGTKKHYSMLVFSNPVEGLEEEYEEWYMGQHIHDLLRIPGYVGCKFFKIADIQLSDIEQAYQYMIIWDFETDDFKSVVKDITDRMQDGRTVFIPAFDINDSTNNSWSPITKYVTAKEIEGKNVEEVLEIAKLTTKVAAEN